jgi:hypothetical protein
MYRMYGMSVLFGTLTDRSENAEDFGSFRWINHSLRSQAQRERIQIHILLRHPLEGRGDKYQACLA